jgi:hypothetical protein
MEEMDNKSELPIELFILSKRTKDDSIRVFLAIRRKGKEKREIILSSRELIRRIMKKNYATKLYRYVRHYLEEKAGTKELGVGEYQILYLFYENLSYYGFLLSMAEICLELQSALYAYEFSLVDIFRKIIEMLLLISDPEELEELKKEIKRLIVSKNRTLPLLYRLYIMDRYHLARILVTLKNILDLFRSKEKLDKEDEEQLKELLDKLLKQLAYANVY